jgi:hypothetical protein
VGSEEMEEMKRKKIGKHRILVRRALKMTMTNN